MASPAKAGVLPRRGDVVLVPFPFPDLTGQKVRPAVVVSPDPQGEDALVAFISSVVSTETAPTDWHPKRPSVLKAGKLVTLHRSLILRHLGHLDPTLQTALDRCLLRAVGVSRPA